MVRLPSAAVSQTQNIEVHGNAADIQIDQRLDATGLTIRQVLAHGESASAQKQVIVVFGDATGATFEQSIIVPEGLPLRATERILRRYGEETVEIGPDRIEKILAEKADEHQTFLKRLALLPTDDPEVDALRDQAVAVNRGVKWASFPER